VRRMLVLALLLALVMIVSLAACGGTEPEPEPSEGTEGTEPAPEAPKQELSLAMASDVVGLSPILTNDSVSSSVNDQMYETLFKRDWETNEIGPLLATGYETVDENTWLITLRDGVKFHDGTPFNADAVKFTFERLIDPETAAPRASLLQMVDKIEVVDDLTVRIITKYPYGAFLAALTHGNSAIVSPTAVEEYGDLMNNPVGTGPFKLKERIPGESVTLERNPDYWGEPAALDTITYRIVPEAATRVAMLETGEIDVLTGVTPEYQTRLSNVPDVTVETRAGTPVSYLGFNHQKSPWDKWEVRKAVQLAVDIESLIEIREGQAIWSPAVIGPRVFGYKEEIEDYAWELDPERAMELLAEAGYPDGFETGLMISASDPVTQKMAQIIQENLRAVGIDVEIEEMEWAAYLDATAQPDHDLYILGWTNSTADGSELVYPNLHSDNAGSNNRSFYMNPTTDELIMRSRQTTDQAERLEILHEANVALIEDVAWVTLSHNSQVWATRNNVKGFKVAPNARLDFYPVSIESE